MIIVLSSTRPRATSKYASQIRERHGARVLSAASLEGERELLDKAGAGGMDAPLAVVRADEPGQISDLKKYGAHAVHVHLDPETPDPWQGRLLPSARRKRGRAGPDPGSGPDTVIRTKKCTTQDVMARIAARMSPRGPGRGGYVDVIVGGQYGSEGKGQIAAYLAHEYDLLVRVGGPNAGHWVPGDKPYAHHHLPSGTTKSKALLLLGPGTVINVKSLLVEIADCRVDRDRLSIDPQAMTVEPKDREAERRLVKSIGSTGQGVGHATARKVMRYCNVRLAGKVPDISPYIRPAADMLERLMAERGRAMLEGTQGTGLSLHHGSYPHVTSRETTASGCIADAGIPPRMVRRIVMVTRTYPIRVQSPKGGTSGPMSIETTLQEISRRSGKDLKKMKGTEVTTTTRRKRRIGEFDWDLVRRAALLNGPTDVALTFGDYIAASNEGARSFGDLTPETALMADEVERVTGARVSLISTGFGLRTVVDRRAW